MASIIRLISEPSAVKMDALLAICNLCLIDKLFAFTAHPTFSIEKNMCMHYKYKCLIRLKINVHKPRELAKNKKWTKC